MKIDAAALLDGTVNIAGAAKKEDIAVRAEERETFAVYKPEGTHGLFGDATYGKPSRDGEEILEDIASQAEVSDATQMKNERLFAVNTTSEEDGKKLEEDGFSLNSTEIKTVVTETDKIKAELAKAGVDISMFGDGLTREQLEEITGNAALAQQMEALFAQADLPLSEQNLTEANKSLQMAKELTGLSDNAVKYLLDNGLEPTIENLYKAEYSGNYRSPEETADYSSFMNQIEKVIKQAGFEVTEETIEDSKWMIANQVSFTPENFAYMQKLEQLLLPPDEAKVMKAIVQAIAEGGRPKDAMLIEGFTLADKAKEASDVVKGAQEMDLAWLVENDRELTVENLKEAAEHRGDGADERSLTAQKELLLLTARRQLEEARLAMTAQANYSLLKQGISVDTKPLAELVDTLKAQENAYYEKLLTQAGIAADETSVAIFRETVETVEALKDVPSYTLGIPQADEETLKGLYRAGKEIQNTLDKAGERYDTMMTKPRADMGDTIQKAFANVDDILRDLGFEQSEENQRAVRILAYNNLEITEQSVMQIKAADEAVSRAFKNMTPSVVREMIRDGVNPLDMNIAELNREAVRIKQELGIEEEERFSKYLWKLDQSKAISEEERNAFLGIYRLITQVEKTDGAAIGALLAQGGEVTMRNLLTQIRSAKHGGKEYTVDDAFSGVDGVKGGLSITEQIEMGYQADCIRDALDEITPDKMAGLVRDQNWQDMTPEQFAKALASLGEETELDAAYTRAQLEEFEEAAMAPGEVYRMLSEYDLPNTTEYVTAAYEMIKNRNKIFEGFFGEKIPGEDADSAVDFEEIKRGLLEKFAESLKTPEEMAKAQKALADTAENVMKTMITEDENVTSIDLRQMKLLNTQIAIGTKQAKEETYAIPVLVGDEITNISLKIVRGKEKKGLVDITFSTDKLGKVAAQLKAGKSGVSGYVACEKRETADLLAQRNGMLSEALEQTEGGADIRYVTSENLNLVSFGSEDISEQGEGDAVLTKTLYGMAESFIKTVKSLQA